MVAKVKGVIHKCVPAWLKPYEERYPRTFWTVAAIASPFIPVWPTVASAAAYFGVN